MDNEEKVSIFRASLGGTDADFARSVLEAYGWDLQAALNSVLDGGGASAPAAPPPEAEEVRAPMRVNYFDTLMAPATPEEQRRAEMERLERQKEAERQAEERRRAEERSRQEEMERQVLQQRAQAERLAIERRRAQQEKEAAEAASRDRAGEVAAANHEPSESRLLSQLESQTPADAAAHARAPPEPVAAEPPAAAAEQKAGGKEAVGDATAQALMALRRRYIESDPDGLATCLETLRTYVSNLARQPHEVKFQRINCENAAFQKRVGNFEGAIEVLTSCGFVQEVGCLAVGPDFVKTKGSRMWDVLRKLEVMTEQVKSKVAA